MSLNLDVTALFTQINVWLPVAFTIGSIGIGIPVAFGLVDWIGNRLMGAFKRK